METFAQNEYSSHPGWLRLVLTRRVEPRRVCNVCCHRRRLYSLVFGTLLLLVSACSAKADIEAGCRQDADPKLKLSQCSAAIDSGRWSGKDLAWAYDNRGSAHTSLERYRPAIVDYDRALQLDPGVGRTYFNRGKLYLGADQFKKAIADFDRAIELEADFSEAYEERGFANSKLGRDNLALDDYNQALRLGEQSAITYHRRGIVYRKLARHEDAFSDFEQALVLAPGLAAAYVDRGILSDQLGQHDNAIDDFDLALELKPNLARAYYHRGRAYRSLGQPERTFRDWESMIGTDSATWTYWWQNRLARKGYYSNPLDSWYDDSTRSALLACARDPAC